MKNATVLTIAVLLLVSCAKWPPDQFNLIGHFEAHRDAYSLLDEKLSACKYERVSKYLADLESLHVRVEGQESLEVVKDTDGWREILQATSTLQVGSKNGEFRALVSLNQNDAGRMVSAVYSHGPEFLSKLPACHAEHEAVQCGLCFVDLFDDWGLVYEWWPANMLPEESARNQAGQLSNAEYLSLYESAVESCWKDGSEEMGFEIPVN